MNRNKSSAKTHVSAFPVFDGKASAHAIQRRIRKSPKTCVFGDWRKHEEMKTLAALVDEDGGFAA